MKNNKYQVLLYYKYIDIENPEKVREEQVELCEKLNLKGRIILAKEGINGTVEGLVEDTEKYIAEMNKSKCFSGLSFKKSHGTGNAFSKLFVRVRPEIIASGKVTLSPQKVSGKYITADELHAWFESKKEFYIVDMRNDYEYISGFFEGFIPSGVRNFYEIDQVIPRIKHLRDKTIVTVCTGGIRCEKASGLLVENGFSDVYQLKDGIHTYMEKYPNKHFKGKLYVFDSRLTVGFNTDSPEHEIVGKCDFCKKPCDSYVNCTYNFCHRHFISCKDCVDLETGFSFCNAECKMNWRKVELAKKQASV